MKINSINSLFFIFFIFIISLGCLESYNTLSSDYTPVGKNTISQINDQNVSVSYICEKQPICFNLYNKYIISGNVTNTGNLLLLNLTIAATFFGMNNYYSPFYNNEVESRILYLGSNDTANFTIQKQSPCTANIESYKLKILY
jgi:hypothetical protein